MSASLLVTGIFLPFCASSLACATGGWREGFRGENQLQLVGEGHANASLPQVQRQAMAKEAAIIDAMSHWTKFCAAQNTDEGIARFRVENQKKRVVECEDSTCRARVVIEKDKLREQCSG
ncbi:hypothetical protein [Turneriella parva]|nr:hypothetical protein [Turneriella parva]